MKLTFLFHQMCDLDQEQTGGDFQETICDVPPETVDRGTREE